MATHLYSPFTLHCKPPSTTTKTTRAHVTIRCGPRSNRGQLVKGRILSTEAIQAVQSLKRTHKTSSSSSSSSSSNGPNHSQILLRLIKSDLVATLRELLRQGYCDLALTVFSTVRSEPWYNKPDLGLYSDLILVLDKNGMRDDIDRLIEELEMGGEMIDCGDKKGLGRLIRALIGAERRESTVRIYGVMKRSGWGSKELEVDEYVGKMLSKGLRRFKEEQLAKEVEEIVENYVKACLGRVEV